MDINKKSKIIIVAFVACLIAPSVIYNLGKQYFDTNNYENRELASKPDFELSTIVQFPTQYENYYNDHIPFRNELMQLNAYINLKVFRNTENSYVILGKDNWLFYSGEERNTVLEYEAKELYTEQELQLILRNVEKYRDDIKESVGADFVLMLIPDKEHIYEDMLPDTMQTFSSIKRVDQIYEYITKHSDIKVCYPYAELMEAKEDYQVYYKYDTHWNNVGAYVGTQSLLNMFGFEQVDDAIIEKEKKVSGDLANMAALNSILNDDFEYVISSYLDEVQVKNVYVDERGTNHKYNSTSSCDKTLYFIGDSFKDAMKPFLAKRFNRTIVAHRDYFERDDMIAERPDIVVYQLIERKNTLLTTIEFK